MRILPALLIVMLSSGSANAQVDKSDSENGVMYDFAMCAMKEGIRLAFSSKTTSDIARAAVDYCETQHILRLHAYFKGWQYSDDEIPKKIEEMKDRLIRVHLKEVIEIERRKPRLDG
jgi:hypothetical protein